MSEEHQTETPTPEQPQASRSPGLANGVDAAEVDDAPAPSWREDWRSALAGGDEKRAKQLERFSTPENVAKAFFDVREKLTRGLAETEPPVEASEVELKDWRRRAGVPESPEGYAEHLKEFAFETETQKAELASYLRYAHEKNLPPRAVRESVAWLKAHQAAVAEKEAEISEEATLHNLAEAKQIFPGREWQRMFGTKKNGGGRGLANEFLNGHFVGPEAQKALTEMLDMKLSSGVKVADSVHWLKAIAAMARQVASEDELIGGDGAGGGKSIDEEFKELTRKPNPTQAERDRMLQLAEARERRAERAAR